jgi:hypothetical protein
MKRTCSRNVARYKAHKMLENSKEKDHMGDPGVY